MSKCTQPHTPGHAGVLNAHMTEWLTTGGPPWVSQAPGIVQQTHLLKELLLQLVCPALVRLAVCCQVANVSALQHHLHRHNGTVSTLMNSVVYG